MRHHAQLVVYILNVSIWEVETEESRVQGQPGPQSEFQDSQGYTKNKTKIKKVFVLFAVKEKSFLTMPSLAGRGGAHL